MEACPVLTHSPVCSPSSHCSLRFQFKIIRLSDVVPYKHVLKLGADVEIMEFRIPGRSGNVFLRLGIYLLVRSLSQEHPAKYPRSLMLYLLNFQPPKPNPNTWNHTSKYAIGNSVFLGGVWTAARADSTPMRRQGLSMQGSSFGVIRFRLGVSDLGMTFGI